MLQDNWAKAVFSELWEGTAKMVGAVKSTLGWCGVFLAAMLSASTTQAQTVSQGGPGGSPQYQRYPTRTAPRPSQSPQPAAPPVVRQQNTVAQVAHGLRGRLNGTTTMSQPMVESEQPWVGGEVIMDQDAPPSYGPEMGMNEGYYSSGTCNSCGSQGGGCDDCGPWVREDCGHDGCCYDGCCDDFCRNWCWMQDLTITGGFQGFKGPADLGMNGNFGANFGVNWGGPLWHRFGLGYQIGYRGTTSNFTGDPIGPVPGSNRTQHFLTAGFFHRLSWRSYGWQWGVAFDALQDNYYVDTELDQMRVELSRFFDSHEIGFVGSFAGQSDTQPFGAGTITLHAADLYRFFLRERFAGGSELRVWGGVTGRSDGLLGGEMHLPLSSNIGSQS